MNGTKGQKKKLQNWVTVEQAEAIKAYLDEGKALKGGGCVVQVKEGAIRGMDANAEVIREMARDKGKIVAVPLVDKEVERWKEQARMQGIRADDELGLRVQAEAKVKEMAAKIDDLNNAGGTERQAKYISVLLSKLEAAGVKKSEYDQEPL